MNKEEIREKTKEIRRNLSPMEISRKSLEISERLTALECLKTSEVVMSYMPIHGEVDTTAIHPWLFKKNIQVLLPRTDAENRITPVALMPDSVLSGGKFGILEPTDSREYNGKIDAILLPCVAADRLGNRIGYGKGCYDRFLKDQNTLKILLCYQFQLYDRLPSSPWDQKADIIITEEEIVEAER